MSTRMLEQQTEAGPVTGRESASYARSLDCRFEVARILKRNGLACRYTGQVLTGSGRRQAFIVPPVSAKAGTGQLLENGASTLSLRSVT